MVQILCWSFFLEKPCVRKGHVAHVLAPCDQRLLYHLRKQLFHLALKVEDLEATFIANISERTLLAISRIVCRTFYHSSEVSCRSTLYFVYIYYLPNIVRVVK